jgi:hypothetical protein
MGLAVVAIALIAAPVAVFAKGKPATVEICHVNGASDIIHGQSNPDNLWAFGQVIEVPETAVPGHEGHGDSTTFRGPDHPGWDNLHEVAAADETLTIWKHADCFVAANG